MTDDLDLIIRKRLGRLAATVPIRAGRALMPVVRTAPRYRGRSRLNAVAAVAILLVLIGGATYLAGGSGSKAVRGSSTDGTFTLTITSPKDRYVVGSPIEVSATLEYVGASSQIQVSGTPGVPGFGVQRLDGSEHAEPGYRLSCVSYSFDHARPVAFPFSKSGGFTPEDPNAEFMKAYLNIAGDHADPSLRLPAGTWRIFADMDLAEGGCAGPTHHHLQAAVTIVVRSAGSVVVKSTPVVSPSSPSILPALPSARPTLPPAGVALPYPAGCATFGFSDRRCAFIVAWAKAQLAGGSRKVMRVELMGDPDCVEPANGNCNTSIGSVFVVRVRFTTNQAAMIDKSVRCMLGGEYSLLCTNTPTIGVPNLANSGYWDTPCNPGPAPAGCATPMPTIDPDAAAAAVPLSITALDVPIDHVGDYRIELGTATIPNGQLTQASIQAVSTEGWVLVAGRGLRITLNSMDPSRPAFESAYAHGWYPGVEQVIVALEFSILQFDPGSIISLGQITVR